MNKNSPFSICFKMQTFHYFTLSHKLIILFICYGLCLSAQTKIYFGSSGNLHSVNTDLTGHKLEYSSNQFSSEYPWFTLDQISGKILFLKLSMINDQVELNSLDLKDSTIQNLGELGKLALEAFLEYDFFNGKIYFSDFINKQIASYNLNTQIIQSIYSWPDMKQDSRFQLDPWNQLIFIPRSGGLDKFSLQNQTTEFISLLEPIKCFRIHPLLHKLTVKNSSICEFTYDGTLLRKFNILPIDGDENDLHYDLSSNILYSYSFRDHGAGFESWYIQKLDDQLFSRSAIYSSHQPFFKNMVFLYEKIPTAVNNPKLESEEIVIYPNPNSGNFEIRWVGVSEYPSSIDLYTVYGTNVPISIQPSGFSTLLCKLNNYQSGIYTLVIRFGNNKRIIKKINIL